MTRAGLLLVLLILPATALAQFSGLPPNVQAAIKENEQTCDKSPKFQPKFITERDINGDGVRDYILDYGEFECDGSATYFCGTGGCLTQVFASLPNGGYVKALDENVRDIKFRQIGKRSVIVLDLHGSACGKVGAAPCPRVLAWDGKTFKRATLVPGMTTRK
ncbi:MAG: hypothetical protein QOH67_2756 [Hyphomicrobiales bacterium]|jgi:hypothetical protein|nr:hypothetical protein [Hyphomicrobiales bacterium]